MTEELGLWRIADPEPERLAVATHDGHEVTYGELAALSNRFANGLRAQGLKQGDGIAVALPNSVEFIALYFAAMQSGLYFTPINWHLVGPEIAYIVGDSEASIFVAHERFADVAQTAAKEIPEGVELFAVGGVDGYRDLGELTQDQPDTRPEDRSAGGAMHYTSGTTGKPKGVRRALTGADPDEAAAASVFFFGMFDIQAHDGNVHICGSPLYHTAVLVFSSNSINLGHPVVLMDKWAPEEMLLLIDRYDVTHSHMVPTQFHRLLALPDEVKQGYDLSSLRTMIHAAAPCPVDIKRRMLEWWGPVIYEYYAATEGGGTLVTPEQWLKKPGTVGTPWPTSEIKIFDDDANEMPTGEPGTVYMRMGGPASFEYFKDEEKTKKARLDEYFTVGDIGYLDEDGYLFLHDRKSDMIISGGVNIYPAEIEGEFLTHSKVGDVAVFGIPHEDWGEEIKAVIEPAGGVEAGDELAEELMAFARERLAKFKIPRSVDFIDEMPRDPNGKLYKRKLRDPYWEGRTRAI